MKKTIGTGAELRRLRVARGWSLRDLAERSKIQHNAIWRIENGQHIRERDLTMLLHAFDLTLAKFYGTRA